MTNEERNAVLEDAARCVENLGEPHYFQFAARMVRELKREEPPQTKSKVIEGVNLTGVVDFKAKEAFRDLWQSINCNWNANPYVFAYKFRKI